MGRRTLGVEKRGRGRVGVGVMSMCAVHVCAPDSTNHKRTLEKLPWLEGERATFGGGGGHRTRKMNGASSHPVAGAAGAHQAPDNRLSGHQAPDDPKLKHRPEKTWSLLTSKVSTSG